MAPHSKPKSDDEPTDFAAALAELAQETAEHPPAADEPSPDAGAFLEGLEATTVRSRTPISADAVALLIAAEVSSEATYRAKYTGAIWPGGQSGVTIGIGYDVGTVSPAVLAQDWASEFTRDEIERLAQTCGVLGPAAARLLPGLRGLSISFETASRVFSARSVPQFVARTERALPNTALLHPDCLGALVSLAYNRGAAFNRTEDRFREMRAIRDHMQDRRFDLIPAELRSMKRIWADKPGLRGLLLRREAEARLFERGLAARPVERIKAAGLEAIPLGGAEPEAPAALEGLFSTIGGWLQPVIEEPTRNHVMFTLARPGQDADLPVERDVHYVAIRLLSGRIVNARRWMSLYHGAVHATCSMLYEGHGRDRVERQAVLAPDGFRDIDPKGQGKLLQVDRPLFGPMPYRGDLRLSVALFSVKSSDLAAPYLSLISDLSQTVGSGFLAAAQPFVAPLKTASDLLFGTSDAASLECGTIRGFEPLRAGTWVCIGATRDEIGPTDGFSLDPEDFRLLDGSGEPVEDYPYLVFEIARLTERDNFMEIPGLKAAWDAILTALTDGKADEARAASKAFGRACFAGGDLTETDAARLAKKAERKVALAIEAGSGSGLESLRSLDLAEEPSVDLSDDAHTDTEAPPPSPPEDGSGLEKVRPWRVAKSLLRLREQVNAKAPGRSKASDGTIGDAAHATRSSDHNPWVLDGATGVVTAMDITHDPNDGCDAAAIAEALRTNRDPRIKNVIWNRRIFSATVKPWTWRPYDGKNPHDKHVHISVSETKSRYDDTADWDL